MLTLLIAIITGTAVGIITGYDLLSPGWGIVCGIAAALTVNLIIGLTIRKKVGAIQAGIESRMQAVQTRIARQIQIFQQKPSGNPASMRKKIEEMQFDAMRETLRDTVKFEKFYPWNMMLSRQIATMKMQLYFQLREFGKANEYMKRALFFDIRSKLIKLVMLYRDAPAELDRFYNSKFKRVKGDEAALAACTYAWMKLHQNEPQTALNALIEAKKVSCNEQLLGNYEQLANGRNRHFTMSGFGDAWYALYLEEPKFKQVRTAQRGF